MKLAVILPFVLGALAGPVAAQQRPPDAPAAPDGQPADPQAVTDDRPPERPADAQLAPGEDAPEARPDAATDAQTAQPDAPVDAPEAAPQQDTGQDVTSPPEDTAEPQEVAQPAEQFGPPPPPLWYQLVETDQEYQACKLALTMLGTVYEERPAQTEAENRDCGIARPIMVQRVLPDLELDGGALMRCDTARALGFWARDFVRPAAATLPGAPRVIGMQLGSTYDCRGRIGTGEAQPKLSEHALGTAIDIASFRFDAGAPLVIEPRQDTGDQAESFQRAVQSAACLYFTTVLGPGSNAAHDQHLHLDAAVRRGGWRLCQ